MAISPNPKPTIYRNLYENTGPAPLPKPVSHQGRPPAMYAACQEGDILLITRKLRLKKMTTRADLLKAIDPDVMYVIGRDGHLNQSHA